MDSDAFWCQFPFKRFHALSQKKKGGNKTVPFLGGTVSPSSSPGHATGEEKFLFFSLVSSSLSRPTCSVKVKTGRHLHLLMMRKHRGRVLQAMPPLDVSPGAMTRWSGGFTPHANDGTGQGRSRSPCPYKYCPNAEEKGGPKERVFERERGREKERKQQKRKEKKQGKTKEEEKRKKKKKKEREREDKRRNRGRIGGPKLRKNHLLSGFPAAAPLSVSSEFAPLPVHPCFQMTHKLPSQFPLNLATPCNRPDWV